MTVIYTKYAFEVLLCKISIHFRSVFEHDDSSVREYAMMVLYNSMFDEAAKYLIQEEEGHLTLISLVNSLCDDLVDWG